MLKKKRKRKTSRTTSEVVTSPEIVKLAAHIVQTESVIQRNVTRNVQLQMKLNECVNEEQNLRKVLAGLHREMDKFTASTRLL